MPTKYVRKQPVAITCVCGKEFESAVRKHCSLQCKARAKYWRNKNSPCPPFMTGRRSKRFPCEVCGKEVYQSRCQRRRTCSRECLAKWTKANPDRRMYKTGNCAVCGNELTNRNHGKRYCSIACYLKGQVPHEAKDCAGCGKSYKRNSRYFTERSKYCSKRCQLKYSRGLMYPGYRGKREGDRGPNWRAIAKEIRLRDNFTCQGLQCTTTQLMLGKCLPVDHIVPYRLAKEHGNANDAINLITLCPSCHSKKTPQEMYLLRGDVMGWLARIRNVYERPEIAMTALRHYGLQA